MNYFKIRDDVLNNTELKKYLDSNDNIKPQNIGSLLGESIVNKNTIGVSLLNLYIRENNIKITKKDILEGIYWSECREKSREERFNNVILDFCDFTNEIYNKYYIKYNYMFKK